jgi:hypothetical protein
MTITNNTTGQHVFLGGTCGDNNWRKEIVIPLFESYGISSDSLFDPVVEHWDAEAQAREDDAKRTARFMLFVIASPDPQSGTANVSAYSLVELIMGLYDDPDRTVAVFDTIGMASHAAKAINKSFKDLLTRFPGAPIFSTYGGAVTWIAQRM